MYQQLVTIVAAIKPILASIKMLLCGMQLNVNFEFLYKAEFLYTNKYYITLEISYIIHTLSMQLYASLFLPDNKSGQIFAMHILEMDIC
jgi:hypothetical protein